MAPGPEPWALQTPSGFPQPPADTPAARRRLVGKGLTRALEGKGLAGCAACQTYFRRGWREGRRMGVEEAQPAKS